MLDAQSLVRQIETLHDEAVDQWHRQPLTIDYDGFLAVVCQQHQYNFLLWHEEDIARSPTVGDTRIAEVKRSIDRYNQQRNDWIERIDQALIDQLITANITASPQAPLNTETPGSAIDRLSILALRIYHLREQGQRTDVDSGHLGRVETKLAICNAQRMDLSLSLTQLLVDIFAGWKQLKLYRQVKMYNDPGLNPYLYGTNK